MENLNHDLTNLSVPKEKQIIQQAISNIYVGLDKATNKGIFTLKEAGQLTKDLELIVQIMDQVMKFSDKQN